MSYPRISYILHILLLTFALSCAATGIADARGTCDEWAGAEAAVVVNDADAFAPEREESRPSADEIGKQRLRPSTAAAVRVKTAIDHPLNLASWSIANNSSFVDPLSLSSSPTPRSSHACGYASPRLQLKLQLGQAP